MHVTTPNGR